MAYQGIAVAMKYTKHANSRISCGNAIREGNASAATNQAQLEMPLMAPSLFQIHQVRLASQESRRNGVEAVVGISNHPAQLNRRPRSCSHAVTQ